MKTNLIESIIAFVAGIIIAYIAFDMILPSQNSTSIKTIGTGIDYTVVEPDPEIFNYRAINPTVEVYVGQCEEYDENGNCLVDTQTPADQADAEGPDNGAAD